MKRYTISQLEAFTAIAECGSFRLAAERLGITQPTISLRIRDLETAFGCRLFLRGKGGVRLSETGQVLLQYARRGLESLDEMELRLKTSDPLSGVLRLGSSNTFALSCLPTILAALEQTHPRLNVELTISNSITLSALLDTHKLDVAFLVESPLPPHIKSEPLALSDLAWFASPGTWIGARTIRPRDLAGLRIMTLPSPSLFHSVVSDWFAAAEEPLPTLSTCNDMVTILRLVRTGMAVSILPTSIAGFDLEAGTIVRYRAAPSIVPVTLCAAYQASVPEPARDIIVRTARDAVARPDNHLIPIWNVSQGASS